LIKIKNKISIFGTGGFGQETFICLSDILSQTNYDIKEIVNFIVDDRYYNRDKLLGISILPLSEFNPNDSELVIGIGNPQIRKKIVEQLPNNTKFSSIIHPSVKIPNSTKIGDGCIITSGSIISVNVNIGNHSQLNFNSIIGHDCIIGDFFTTAPSVNINGNCKIGKNVYMGTNCAIRQNISICDNAIIGMGSVVIKDITQEGTYFGNPSRKILK